MGDVYINDTSYYDYVNDTSQDMSHDYNSTSKSFDFVLIINVVTCIIICIGLPLTLVAIYALYSLVRTL